MVQVTTRPVGHRAGNKRGEDRRFRVLWSSGPPICGPRRGTGFYRWTDPPLSTLRPAGPAARAYLRDSGMRFLSLARFLEDREIVAAPTRCLRKEAKLTRSGSFLFSVYRGKVRGVSFSFDATILQQFDIGRPAAQRHTHRKRP